jgi:hypothetical protein
MNEISYAMASCFDFRVSLDGASFNGLWRSFDQFSLRPHRIDELFSDFLV